MGFRVRKSIKVVPGVRLNLNAKSVGLSVGVRGAHVSVNSLTGKRTTLGVPGTGVSWTQQSGAAAKRAPGTSSGLPRPGMFAPKWQKVLHRLLEASDTDHLLSLLEGYPEARPTALFLQGVLPPHEAPRELVNQWRCEAWDSGYVPETDQFIRTCLPQAQMLVNLTPLLSVSLPFSRDSLGIATACSLADLERTDVAVAILESLEPTSYAATLLADLYATQRNWRGIIDLSDGLANEDDFATFLLIQRGVAFRELGLMDASRESLKIAFSARSRMLELRHLALAERAQTNLADGKKAAARKDLQRILADDSHYPGIDELLTTAD